MSRPISLNGIPAALGTEFDIPTTGEYSGLKRSQAASAHRLTPEIARRAERQLIDRLVPAIGMPQYQQAFAHGCMSKFKGMMRVTPYYRCPPLDHFWFAGYDGKKFEEALASL